MRKEFSNAELVMLEEKDPTIFLDEVDLGKDVEIKIKNSDLLILFIRHPDVVDKICSFMKPTIIPIYFGVGFYNQLKITNPKVIQPVCMCNTPRETGIMEVDDFFDKFGTPIYNVKLDNDIIKEINLSVVSLCGASNASLDFLRNKKITPELLNNFTIQIIQECNIPSTSNYTDKNVGDFAQMSHLLSLINAILKENPSLLTPGTPIGDYLLKIFYQIQQHVFDLDLHKYEKLLIDFAIETDQFENKSDIELHILTYLFIHESLTQKEILDLSNEFYEKGTKRGFSSGSISQYIQQYKNTGIIEEKTEEVRRFHEYPRIINLMVGYDKITTNSKYLLLPTYLTILGICSPEIGEKEIDKAIIFYTEIIPKLEEIKVRGTYKNQVKEKIIERLKELVDYLQYHLRRYKEYITKLQIPGNLIDIKLDSEVIINKIFSEGLSETTNIEDFEKKLIEATIKSQFFTINTEQYSKILVYLIFREELTQTEIKELTGYSAGTISQGLNYLLKEGFIRKKKIKGKRQKKYVLDSIHYCSFLRVYKKLEIVRKWIPIIKETLNELIIKEAELGSKRGYNQLRNCFEYLNQSIPDLNYLFEVISEEKLKFKPKLTST